MITNKERQFIEHWLEQKSGAKWKYYLQFSLAWTMVAFLVIFFLAKLFTNAWETGGGWLIYLMLVISLIIGFFSTHLTYTTSEKRYHSILQREKNNS